MAYIWLIRKHVLWYLHIYNIRERFFASLPFSTQNKVPELKAMIEWEESAQDAVQIICIIKF